MNKTDLLFQMMEQPQAYTDQQWQEIFSDEECRELYTLMTKTQSAFDAQKDIDDETIDAEWKRLSASSNRSWLRAAAIFIGVLMLSGITFAAIHIIHDSTVIQEPQPEEQPIKQQTVPTDTINNIVHSGPVLFDNVTLDSIAKNIAAYYQIEMDMQNEQASQLRFYFLWQPNDSLQEVIDKLDMFEQVDMAIEHGKLIVR
jgi:hypothetical protein